MSPEPRSPAFSLLKDSLLAALLGLGTLFGAFFSLQLRYGTQRLDLLWSPLLTLLAVYLFPRRAWLWALACGGLWFPLVLWPDNGWAALAPVAALGVWYGLQRARIFGSAWWGPYLSQLLFLLAHFVLQVLAAPQLAALNPPFWAPEAPAVWSLDNALAVWVKGLFNYTALLIFADALVQTGWFHRALGRPTPREQRVNSWIFVSSLVLGIGVQALHLLIQIVLEGRSFAQLWFLTDGALPMFLPLSVPAAVLAGRAVMAFSEDRLASLDQLRRERSRQNRLVAHAGDLVVEADAQGSLTSVSAAAERITGYRPEELRGPLTDWVHPEDQSRLWDTWHQMVADPSRPHRIRYRHRHKEGGWVHLETVGQSFLQDQELNCVLMQTRDVSEAVAYEEELQAQYDEMARFTHAVSHDLKSPLITIKGFARSLVEDLNPEPGSRAASDLSRILGAADRMGALLESILHVSRLGRVPRQPESLDLGAVAREAWEQVQGLSRETQAVWVWPEAWPRVWADRMQLSEILQNLFENALKYRQPGQVPEIRLSVKTLGREVELTVADKGRGLAPDQTERIFGLFTQIEPGSEGTGLGLALVRRLVQEQGGRVWAESPGLGQGSRFMLTLPRAAG